MRLMKTLIFFLDKEIYLKCLNIIKVTMKVRGVSSIVLLSWPFVSSIVSGSAMNPGGNVECVPCDVLFSNLQDNSSGTKSQYLVMQLRGEMSKGQWRMTEKD